MEIANQQSGPIENPIQQSLNAQPLAMSSPNPHKSRNALLILVTTGVILIIGIGGYFYLVATKNSQYTPQASPTNNPVASGQEEVLYTKFNGPSGRFSFEYPAKWKVTKNEEKGEYLLEYPQDFVAVFIAEQSYSITEGSIEKNFSEALEKQKTELSAKGHTNFSQSQFKKDDKYFFRLDYDLTPLRGINRKGIFLYVVKANTFYSVSMAVDEPKYSQVINDFEHLIQTFQ